MGAAGSKFIKSKAATAKGLRGGSHPPHPLRVKPGQRYWPRRASSGKANRIPIQILTNRGGSELRARREDAVGKIVFPKADRLLAVDPDGQGSHYTFLGWRKGHYRTPLWVLDVAGDGWARVIVPEWHPSIPAKLHSRLLPDDHRHAGACVLSSCDLSATAPAHLNIRIVRPVKPSDLAGVHPPDPELVAAAEASATSAETDQASADIVVALTEQRQWDIAYGLQPRSRGLYFTGAAPPVGAGATLYLASDGRVLAATTLRAVRPAPMGYWLVTDGTVRLLEQTVPVTVARTWWRQEWRWRWWPLDGQDADPRDEAFPYAAGGQDRRRADGSVGALAVRSQPLADLAGEPRPRPQKVIAADEARRLTGRRITGP